MAFVKRGEDGRIVAVSAACDEIHHEQVAETSAELEAFMREISGPAAPLVESDLRLVRVLEDVIDLLVEKGVFRFTDLPAPAQEKLLSRRSLRSSLRGLNLLGEEGDGLF
jgi:hypothetical protein